MSFFRDLGTMFGKPPPGRPKEYTDAAEILHSRKRGRGMDVVRLLEEIAAAQTVHTWRNRRWAVLITINLLFGLSFWVDVQLFEGSLTSSRVLGFHMTDPYSAMLVMLAERHIPVNLLIGMVTIMLLWGIAGGRIYCSWVCPYHLVAEWSEMLHTKFAERGWVRDHPIHRGVRTVFWLLFALLALLTGHTLFLTLNPIGILSRAVIYGPPLALLWVVLLLVFEIVYAKRAWCRYVCPIGLTLGVVGAAAPVRLKYSLERCAHEGECRKVCEVPHVLEMTIKGRADDAYVDVGPDCTRCGLCVDICPTESLVYQVKGLSGLL